LTSGNQGGGDSKQGLTPFVGTERASFRVVSQKARLCKCKGNECTPNFFNIPIPTNTPIDNSSTHALVLACVESRFVSALEDYLLYSLVNNGLTYDLVTLSGASLGGNGACGHTIWSETLIEHIKVASALHSIEEIWIFDHLTCSAYGCIGDDSINAHNGQFETLRASIVGDISLGFTDPSKIKGFVINSSGCFFEMPAPNVSLGRCAYVPPASGEILVFGCIDPRFQSILSSFLYNFKRVQFNYDLFFLAGASLGANQSYLDFDSETLRTPSVAGAQYPLNLIPQWGCQWGPTFFENLATMNISEIWVFDHLDCGAYKRIKFGNSSALDIDIEPHTEELVKLQGYVKKKAPRLRFKGFVMDKSGVVRKVVDDICAV
jgi:carbonic anhydrase